MGCCLEWSCWCFLKQFDKTKVKSLCPALQESEKVLLVMKHINQINRKVSVDSFQLIVIKYHTFIIYINHISFCMSKRTQKDVRVVHQKLVDALAEELAESLPDVCFSLIYFQLEVLWKENAFLQHLHCTLYPLTVLYIKRADVLFNVHRYQLLLQPARHCTMNCLFSHAWWQLDLNKLRNNALTCWLWQPHWQEQ